MKTNTGFKLFHNGGKLHLVTSLVVVYLTFLDSNVLGQNPFTFEDIYTTSARGFSAQWIAGTNAFLYRNSAGHLMRFNATTRTETVFINGAYFTNLSSTYYLSADYQYALFATEVTPIWRHSFNAKYKILNIASGEIRVFPTGETESPELQYAGWGPDGSLTYVTGNNVFYQANVSSQPIQVTTSGDPTWVYNGISDWLYEEDVFGDRVAHYFSPSGRYILYAEFNDTGVPLQPWPYYGPKSNVYVQTLSVPYPKAGDVRGTAAGPNPKVTLYLVDTTTLNITLIRPVPNLQNQDHYYTQAVWRDDETFMVTWTNRVQNSSWAALYNATEPDPQPFVNHDLQITNGWVEVPPADVKFIYGGDFFLTILPEQVSDTSGSWRHLAVVSSSMDQPANVTFLTHGEEETTAIVGFHAFHDTVYYISTGGDPAERHLFSVGLDGTNRHCWTCDQPAECRYVTASLSPLYTNYILGCRGPDIPTYTLRNTLNASDVYVLENNTALRDKLSQIAVPFRMFVNVTTEDNRTLRAEVFFPLDYDHVKKYPLLVYTYAGPGSQRVMKTFPIGGTTSNWLTYMASTHSVIVASVDGRGSAAAGDKLKFEIYRKLGTFEIADQIAAGKFFLNQRYVDTTLPLAIFGWSYGGFTTAHAIGTPGTTFGCGISVAPTTSKAYYDTAYTERYMGLATPGDNAAGYNVTDVMNKVENFHNKSFLVAHGTADDNVHWMHTGQLIRSLSDAGVIFRQNVYLDEDHSISTRLQNRHLFLTLTDFLLNTCWPERQRVTPSPDTTLGTTTESIGGTTRLMTSFTGILLTYLASVFAQRHLSATSV